MAQSHFRSRKKVTGTKYKAVRKKRLCDLGRISAHTEIGTRRAKIVRTRGANTKVSLLSDSVVYVNEGKKTTKLNIVGVTDNPANIHYTRRNVITKGSIVKTEKGEVKITSRPGQSGTLFGVFNK